METYAFIDVPNTTGTVRDCLGFEVDWKRLFIFLTNKKWNSKSVFFYKGYKGETERQQLLNKLEQEIGYTVRTKLTHIHPDKTLEIVVLCDTCKKKLVHTHTIKGNQKSNCDVELTVDALNTLRMGDNALIFSGDGDFSYLVNDLINKGVFVWIISSQEKDVHGNKRFSTRLSQIIKNEGEASMRVKFIDIGRWKKNIEKK